MGGGIVELTVIYARNLNKKDLFSENDACVEFYIDPHHKQKTSVIESAVPIWNETFTLTYENEKVIHFHVFDQDLGGAIKKGIGNAKLDFSHLRRGHTEAHSLTLLASHLDLTPNGILDVAVTLKA
ncbi:C2 domain-containing protein [Zopfochytrium polystomum]|nr:C2 domain-containing protein [Zopfochytrium polystomum]